MEKILVGGRQWKMNKKIERKKKHSDKEEKKRTGEDRSKLSIECGRKKKI